MSRVKADRSPVKTKVTPFENQLLQSIHLYQQTCGIVRLGNLLLAKRCGYGMLTLHILAVALNEQKKSCNFDYLNFLEAFDDCCSGDLTGEDCFIGDSLDFFTGDAFIGETFSSITNALVRLRVKVKSSSSILSSLMELLLLLFVDFTKVLVDRRNVPSPVSMLRGFEGLSLDCVAEEEEDPLPVFLTKSKMLPLAIFKKI